MTGQRSGILFVLMGEEIIWKWIWIGIREMTNANVYINMYILICLRIVCRIGLCLILLLHAHRSDFVPSIQPMHTLIEHSCFFFSLLFLLPRWALLCASTWISRFSGFLKHEYLCFVRAFSFIRVAAYLSSMFSATGLKQCSCAFTNHLLSVQFLADLFQSSLSRQRCAVYVHLFSTIQHSQLPSFVPEVK